MKTQTIIIDGYNVIYRVPRFNAQLDKSLQAGREALLRYCSEWKARRRDVDRFYVVFDGDSSVIGGEIAASAPGVRALYSKTGETADRRIRHMLDQADRNEQITVVSDDNEVRDSARVHHMRSMSALEFSRMGSGRTARSKSHAADVEAPLPPSAARVITDELRDLWET
ncbi:MAG: NYN domain-containing protein [Kiritimatiellae bacterium]|nr:NYN domain-containing protein [Kiritimatiellia bacterium]